MSSMIPEGPAASITLGGGAQQPPQQGGGDGPDSVRVIGLVRRAKALLQQALVLERDHEDALMLEKVTTELTRFLATNQKLVDDPNKQPVKALRKFTPQGY